MEAAITSWRSLRPQKKFPGLTVDEFEAELKPCFDSRQDIADFENKLTGARKCREDMDVKGLELAARLVNAIKSDASEGEDGELLEAMDDVIKSKRRSGPHRNGGAPATDTTKAA